MCEHENTTDVLFNAKVYQHTIMERKYEVAYCLDCGKLVNFYSDHTMTADEIVQMFKDIKSGITAIVAATDDLRGAISDSINAFRDL